MSGEADWNQWLPRLMHDARSLLRVPALRSQILLREISACGPEKVAALQEVVAGHKLLDLFLTRIGALDQALQEPDGKKLPLATVILGARLSLQEKLHSVNGLCENPEVSGECQVPARLQTVLSELLDNAVRFHSPDRALHIKILPTVGERELVLEVSDTGAGWDPEYSPKIFLPFERLDSVRGGFGLGLAIAETIVKKERGLITAATTPEGSKFTVRLPIK